MEFTDLLKSVCLKLNIELSVEQLEKFQIFYELLIEYNGKYNLTAITEEKDVIYKHFADSLSVMMFQNFNEIRKKKDLKMIDVGTGAGFPGIPLKIVNPDIKFTLLDSVNKKLDFIREVCNRLELRNTTVIHGRAEDFGKDMGYREKFDICVSRAVAALPVLSELCIPFVKPGGMFISYKGPDIEKELNDSQNAVKLLGGCISEVKIFNIPDTDIKRSLIMIKKKKNTPGKYPRKAGVPVKNPL